MKTNAGVLKCYLGRLDIFKLNITKATARVTFVYREQNRNGFQTSETFNVINFIGNSTSALRFPYSNLPCSAYYIQIGTTFKYAPVQCGLVLLKFFSLVLKTKVIHTDNHTVVVELVTTVYQEYK